MSGLREINAQRSIIPEDQNGKQDIWNKVHDVRQTC